MPSRHIRRIDLALQGGGAHGAFTWGVLDRLLEDERIEIDAISGTSAGAMNAVVLADGLGRGADVQAADLYADGRADLLVAVFGWMENGEAGGSAAIDRVGGGNAGNRRIDHEVGQLGRAIDNAAVLTGEGLRAHRIEQLLEISAADLLKLVA